MSRQCNTVKLGSKLWQTVSRTSQIFILEYCWGPDEASWIISYNWANRCLRTAWSYEIANCSSLSALQKQKYPCVFLFSSGTRPVSRLVSGRPQRSVQVTANRGRWNCPPQRTIMTGCSQNLTTIIWYNLPPYFDKEINLNTSHLFYIFFTNWRNCKIFR